MIADGKIASIQEDASAAKHLLMPGLVDAHVHIESSMLTPAHFAQAAVVHGTVATVSDPHEIANVLGERGVQFMLDDATQAPLKIKFGAPSCVPATPFETAGAELDATAVAALLSDDRIGYLSEMMNYPGVLGGDPEVLRKIAAAQSRGKPVDGHAPGLRGEDAAKYVAAGITTDHECTSLDEALEKIAAGCRIQIREGSAAKNYSALRSLIDSHPDQCMLCTDDTHPDDLMEGHIDRLAARAIADGAGLFNVLRVACVNAIDHYGLNVGMLREGDPADLIVVDDIESLHVCQTYIDGVLVAEAGKPLFEVAGENCPNQFNVQPKQPSDFAMPAKSNRALVIEAIDGALMTRRVVDEIQIVDGLVATNIERDVLKIAVVNRYRNAVPAVALIRGFGMTFGALASSVAHDSHNIVVVGTDDAAICAAVNEVIANRGGLAVYDGRTTDSLPLPVAGLMARGDCAEVGGAYRRLTERREDWVRG